MEDRFENETELIFSSLVNHTEENQKVYLVGGIVRDILTNKPIHDIDVSYSGNVKKFAKNVADTLGAKFFMLNEEFQTARIIYVTKDNKKRWIDIVATRDNSIERDLYLRDFTINSIAIDLKNRNKIIDPYAGALDLQKKILKITNPNSLLDDPVRIIRGIRLAVQFMWRITPETISSIKKNAELLEKVTNERKRDELFKILDLPNPAIALKILSHLNLIKYSFPPLEENYQIQQSVKMEKDQIKNTVEDIEKFVEFEELVIYRKSDAAMDVNQADMLLYFSGFKDGLSSYFQQRIHEDRNLRSLCFLSFLYFNNCRYKTEEIDNQDDLSKKPNSLISQISYSLKKFVLTKNEENWIYSFLNNSWLIENAILNKTEMNPEFAFNFFNKAKNSGIAICLFTFIRQSRRNKNSLENSVGNKYLDVIHFLLDAYFHHYDEWINPSIYVNGHDVKNLCNIKDGRIIGEILDKIRLKVVTKELRNRSDVIDYLLKKHRNL